MSSLAARPLLLAGMCWEVGEGAFGGAGVAVGLVVDDEAGVAALLAVHLGVELPNRPFPRQCSPRLRPLTVRSLGGEAQVLLAFLFAREVCERAVHGHSGDGVVPGRSGGLLRLCLWLGLGLEVEEVEEEALLYLEWFFGSSLL